MTLVSVFVFDELVAPKIPPNVALVQTLRVLIVLTTTGIAVFVVRRTKRFVVERTRTNVANFFEFIMIVLILLMSLCARAGPSPSSLMIASLGLSAGLEARAHVGKPLRENTGINYELNIESPYNEFTDRTRL